MMRYIYMVMNIHIYGTFEKESQWRGASDRSGHIYVIYTYIHICIHISQTYIDAEFDVESFGMVYLASKGRLGKVICEKHTFLNNLWPPTVRVSQVFLPPTARVSQPGTTIIIGRRCFSTEVPADV